MDALLDTHVWLWAITDPDRLSATARELLSDAHNTIFVSAVCSIEISIKWNLGKLELPEPPETLLPSRLARDRFTSLPITHHHALRLASLPLHHKDPFDRLLIAQGQLEHLPIITADTAFAHYDVKIIRAS